MSRALSMGALRSVFRVSPLFALLWEQWRVTRGVIIFALVVTLGAAYPLYVADNRVHFRALDPAFISYVAYFFGLLIVGIFFTIDYSAAGEVRLGIPSRHYLMPVRRTVIILGHFAYRMMMMVVLAASLGRILVAMYGRDSIPVQETTMIALCGMAYLLAISWSAGRHWGALAVLGALILVWPLYLASLAGAGGVFGRGPYSGPLLFTGVCSVIALSGALRRETIQRSGAVTFATCLERAMEFTPERFAHAETALCWYEWRRRGLVLPLLAVALASPFVLIVAITPVVQLFDPGLGNHVGMLSMAALTLSRLSPLTLVVLAGALASFVAGAYYMVLDRRDSESNFAAAGFRTPVSNRTLLRTRFLVSLASVISMLGMIILFALALDLIAWSAGIPREQWFAIQDLRVAAPYSALAAIPLLAGYGLFCWALTWLPLGVAIAAVSLACMVSLGFSTPDAYSIYACALALAMVGATAYYGRHARSYGRISFWRIMLLCGTAMLISACCAPVWFQVLDVNRSRVIVFGLWLALSVAPALAILFQVYWIKLLRSR